MIASLLSVLNLLVVAGELALAPDGGSGAPWGIAMVLAAAVIATAVIALVVLPALSAATRPASAQPIDPSASVPQSEPDAAGHPLPRAPGRVAAAA